MYVGISYVHSIVREFRKVVRFNKLHQCTPANRAYIFWSARVWRPATHVPLVLVVFSTDVGMPCLASYVGRCNRRNEWCAERMLDVNAAKFLAVGSGMPDSAGARVLLKHWPSLARKQVMQIHWEMRKQPHKLLLALCSIGLLDTHGPRGPVTTPCQKWCVHKWRKEIKRLLQRGSYCGPKGLCLGVRSLC